MRLHEPTDAYRPILLGWLASCDADARRLLRRSVENILTNIAAADDLPDDAQADEYMLCAASAKESITCVTQDWPERNPKLAKAVSWEDVCRVFDQQRYEYMQSMLVALMAADMAAEIKTRIKEAHQQGHIPAIVALLASDSERHCGVVNYLSLKMNER